MSPCGGSKLGREGQTGALGRLRQDGHLRSGRMVLGGVRCGWNPGNVADPGDGPLRRGSRRSHLRRSQQKGEAESSGEESLKGWTNELDLIEHRWEVTSWGESVSNRETMKRLNRPKREGRTTRFTVTPDTVDVERERTVHKS